MTDPSALGPPAALLQAAEQAFIFGTDYATAGNYGMATQFNETAIALSVMGLLKELLSYRAMEVSDPHFVHDSPDDIDLPNPFEPKE